MIVEAQTLHEQATVVIAHGHTTYGLAARRSRGERAVFANHYAPLIRKGGVNVIGLVVGGDPPLLGIETDDPWWGSLALLDMLWQEAEEGCDTLAICLNGQDIDQAVTGNKIAVLATMEGALALEVGPCPESFVNLRTLYRLGLRSLQFVGQGWNCLTDARGEEWPSKGTIWGLSAMALSLVLGTIIALGALTAMRGQLDTDMLTRQPFSIPTVLVSYLDPLAILLEIAAIVLIVRDSRQFGVL